MAHILIDGESQLTAEVHEYLRQWGYTVGRMPVGARARGRASLAECDLVVFLCHENPDGSEVQDCHLKSVRSTESEYLGAQEPDAPLLVIGQGRLAETMGRYARQIIGEIGPSGSYLKGVLKDCLENCLESESGVASSGVDSSERDHQLHFLGHELRSPLTALKTALEVLQGDMGCISDLESEGDGAGTNQNQVRMLEIALRNVRRMHHAVEWSQSLLKFEDSRPKAATRQITLSLLGEELSQISGSTVQTQGPDLTIECDADLLVQVAQQAIQAMRFGNPDLELSLNLDAEAASQNHLQLDIQEIRGGEQPNDPSEESGLDSRLPESDFREANHHLQRFADFLNPSGPLVRAGGEVQVTGGHAEGLGLTLTVEFQPADPNHLTLVC